MDKKQSRIKPFSIIFWLLTLIVSAWFVFLLYRGNYISSNILLLITVVSGALNLICMLIALLAKRKGFQYFLSILLILIAGAGIFADSKINYALNYVQKVFTEIPETTTHSIYLLNHSYYMILDEIDNKTIETGRLIEYSTGDIQPALDGMASRNANLVINKRHRYDNLLNLLKDWNKTASGGVHELMSAILPDEYIEVTGDVFTTEVFLSTLKVKYQYTEEVSSGLDHSEKPDIEKVPFTVLIGGNEARGLKSDTDFLNRSETNILLTVNPQSKKVLLTILPYDLWVETDTGGDRLTYASFYGVSCWENSVARLLDCKIDYYARFNYSAIASLIDAYGGIEVDNIAGFQTFRDVKTEDGWTNPAWYFKPGILELDGSKTLVYLREISHLKNGYDTRWDNTKAVLTGLAGMLLKETENISFSNIFNIRATLRNYQENLRICSELIDNLESFMATDLDTDKLIRFVIREFVSNSDEWSFEIQKPAARYTPLPCYTINSENLNCAVIEETELQNAKAKIKNILDQ